MTNIVQAKIFLVFLVLQACIIWENIWAGDRIAYNLYSSPVIYLISKIFGKCVC